MTELKPERCIKCNELPTIGMRRSDHQPTVEYTVVQCHCSFMPFDSEDVIFHWNRHIDYSNRMYERKLGVSQ